MTLEERAKIYVDQKWSDLSQQAKLYLGDTESSRYYLKLMWERNFYREVARNYEARYDAGK